MRAIQEQYDCKLSDFTVTEKDIEYRERQTKNRQGNKQLRRNAHESIIKEIWRTDGGQRDPYCAFVKYVEHQPKDGKVSGLNRSPSK